MNSPFSLPPSQSGTNLEGDGAEDRLWTPSRRDFLAVTSSAAVTAGLWGALGASGDAAPPTRFKDSFAGLNKMEARIAEEASKEVFEEMRAEAIQSLGPQRLRATEFQRAVRFIAPPQKIARARSRLRTQLKRGDKRLGPYRKQLALANSKSVAQAITASRKKRGSVLTPADIQSLKKKATVAKASGSFQTLYLKLLKFKLTKTYELGKNEVYVGGVKTNFSGSASKIGVMKLGDIKKGKTKYFNPFKTVAAIPFSSWKSPSTCLCSLVFSEHDPFSQKHEKMIQKALDATKKYLKEQMAKYQAALANVLSAAIKIQIIAKLIAAIAAVVVKWALDKFFKWAAGLVGDELAKPLMCFFKAPDKTPWGNKSYGGIHTKYVSGTGFGGYVTYQWSAK